MGKWKNFTEEELSCSHCGEFGCEEDAVDTLQKMRDILGKPMVINSAYRCPEHNAAVGGSKNSYHKKGMAFDISLNGHDKVELYDAAVQAGFTGIGHYSTFMHVDTGKRREWNGN